VIDGGEASEGALSRQIHDAKFTPSIRHGRKGHQNRRTHMVGEYTDRCPLCKAPGPGPDLAAQIDAVGVATCPNCGGRITKQILSTYWNEEGTKEEARRKQEWRQMQASLEKRWWEFWK